MQKQLTTERKNKEKEFVAAEKLKNEAIKSAITDTISKYQLKIEEIQTKYSDQIQALTTVFTLSQSMQTNLKKKYKLILIKINKKCDYKGMKKYDTSKSSVHIECR